MAITVRKEAPARPLTSSAPTTWDDPFRAIRNFMGWDPFREMAPFLAQDQGSFAPAFEVKETNDAYLFHADLPGVKQEDIEVTITQNRLTVAGKRESAKEEKNDRYYAYERSYGSFTRSFTLPTGVDADKVHASLDSGVLTLSIPKKPEGQAKKIDVKAGGAPPTAKA